MTADPQTEQEVSSVIDRFTGAYAGRDLQAMLSCFAPDDGRIVEHWDVLQVVPERAANDNTMF